MEASTDLMDEIIHLIEYQAIDQLYQHYDNGTIVVYLGETDLKQVSDENGFNTFDEYIMRIDKQWIGIITGFPIHKGIANKRKYVLSDNPNLGTRAWNFLVEKNIKRPL